MPLTATATPITDEITRIASPVAGPDDLGRLLDLAADKRCVMIGEASHGTHEYYRWRAQLSRRLIEEHGFGFVAVEGDWPDIHRLNRYVHGGEGESAATVLHRNRRWPTWTWANWEVAAFGEWLRYHNGASRGAPTSIYGLDVYSLWASLAAVHDYLEEYAPGSVEAAERAFRCFEPYREDGQLYGYATALTPSDCEEEVVGLLAETRRLNGHEGGSVERFAAQQNALVARNAERYYRAMLPIAGSERYLGAVCRAIEHLAQGLVERGVHDSSRRRLLRLIKQTVLAGQLDRARPAGSSSKSSCSLAIPRPSLFPAPHAKPIPTFFTCEYPSNASSPFSLPKPLLPYPPKGRPVFSLSPKLLT